MTSRKPTGRALCVSSVFAPLHCSRSHGTRRYREKGHCTLEQFVRDPDIRRTFQVRIDSVVNDPIIDLNGELADVGEDFDYRDRLRNQKWVTDIRRTLVSDYLKQVARGRLDSISEEWARVSC